MGLTEIERHHNNKTTAQPNPIHITRANSMAPDEDAEALSSDVLVVPFPRPLAILAILAILSLRGSGDSRSDVARRSDVALRSDVARRSAVLFASFIKLELGLLITL